MNLHKFTLITITDTNFIRFDPGELIFQRFLFAFLCFSLLSLHRQFSKLGVSPTEEKHRWGKEEMKRKAGQEEVAVFLFGFYERS